MEALSSSFGAYGLHEIQVRLHKWGLAQKKRWGQNFLLDKSMCEKIAKHAYKHFYKSNKSKNMDHDIDVWEIGPGLASLSNALYHRNENGRLTLFEIDHGVIRMLEHYIKTLNLPSHIDVVSGDAEDTLISHAQDICSTSKQYPQLICGNLPYSSGVRLLLSASRVPAVVYETTGEMLDIIPMSVMLQKEAAERLVASINNKTYGVSSVLLQSLYDISIAFEVIPTSFYPIPHVSSVICDFSPKQLNDKCYTLRELKTLQQLVHVSFLQRRKTLRNTLGQELKSRNIHNFEEICMKHGIEMTQRAENITPSQFLSLSCEIASRI